ncbi:SRPBCC domain-containing protein [Nocardiopsis sp. CNT-189]|uniref:SRPBCC domain-containing protein n=1 Tax=Nocardiopsis oceanisediminis TaxID=2816862 RepID=UPI003B3A97BA
MTETMIDVAAHLDAPAERIWPLLAEADGVRRWYAFDGAELDPVPGGTVVFHWKEHGDYRGVVERVVPGSLLALRCSLFPGAEPEPGSATLVEFHVEPDGDGARVRIVETGFAALNCTEEEQRLRARENSEGWRAALELLRGLVEDGKGAR